jgi:hypothetical protein
MSRRNALAVISVLVVLLGINLWFWPDTELQSSATSLGVGRDGYKAAYDLLSELGLPVDRSYLAIGQVPADRSLWLVSPSFLTPGQTGGDVDEDEHDLLKWVGAGGTAVVFGEPGSAWKKLGITSKTSEGGETSFITGDLAPVARELKVSGLQSFTEGGGGRARVRLRSPEGPFALELPVGAGRLVAVADGRFMRNVNLAQGDAGVLVFDLARGLGAPVFDERYHGLLAPVLLAVLMVKSRAIVPLALGLLATLLWIAAQRKWPRRTLADAPQGLQPSIASFVESLGVLYSRVRDPRAVFRAYRSGFIRGIARQMSPRADLPEARVLDRLARDRSLSYETRRWLVDGVLPQDEKELVVAIRAIESYPKIGR